MNFLLSAEQNEFQAAVAAYLRQELTPQRLRLLVDAPGMRKQDLWTGLAKMGVPGLLAEEAHGGMGLQMMDAAIVAETLGYYAAPSPYIEQCLAILSLQRAGSAEQKSRWLSSLAAGSKIATVAFCEAGGRPASGGCLAANSTISGTKRFVTNVDIADLIVVETSERTLALVERDAPGLSITSENGIDQTRPVFKLELHDTPVDPLLNATSEVGAQLQDAALVLLAADAFGGATRCLALCVDYAKTRQQFGVVIGQFQALKHQLANMAAHIEPARGLYWYAAHAYDSIPGVSARAASLAKAHLTDCFLQTVRDAVEVHGGIGYTWDHDLQIFFKRAMFNSAWMGTSRQHRARVAALSDW